MSYKNVDAKTGHCAERPLVAFALFTYNQEGYILEAVEGALNQSYSPLEIIISDDCSTDRTFDLIKDLVDGYEGPHKVRLNKNPKNMGIVPHVNQLLDMIHSDYVVIAAGDDISYPNRVESLVQIFQKQRCSAIYSAADKVNDDGDVIGNVQFSQTSVHRNDFSLGSPAYYGAGAAYSMQIVRRYGLVPCDVRNEDANLMWKALFCEGLAYTNKRLLSYRMHEDNFTITRIIDRMPEGEHRYNKMIENYYNINKNFRHALRISSLRWKPAILRGMISSILRILKIKIKQI